MYAQKTNSNRKCTGSYSTYSQGIKIGKWIFTAGQIPIEPKSGNIISGHVKDKARQVMENIKAVLEASGASMKDVVKTTIYLTNMQDFTAVNEVYGEYFTEPYPARSTVQVTALPKGVSVEIDAIAYTGS